MPEQSALLSLDHVVVKVMFCAIRKGIAPRVIIKAFGFHTYFLILCLGRIILEKGLGCICHRFEGFTPLVNTKKVYHVDIFFLGAFGQQ